MQKKVISYVPQTEYGKLFPYSLHDLKDHCLALGLLFLAGSLTPESPNELLLKDAVALQSEHRAFVSRGDITTLVSDGSLATLNLSVEKENIFELEIMGKTKDDVANYLRKTIASQTSSLLIITTITGDRHAYAFRQGPFESKQFWNLQSWKTKTLPSSEALVASVFSEIESANEKTPIHAFSTYPVSCLPKPAHKMGLDPFRSGF